MFVDVETNVFRCNPRVKEHLQKKTVFAKIQKSIAFVKKYCVDDGIITSYHNDETMLDINIAVGVSIAMLCTKVPIHIVS